MKYTKDSFIVIPDRDALYGMKPDTQAVFMWICRFADSDGLCFPSKKTLSAASGVSKRRVFDCLSELEEAGILRQETRKRGKTFTSNLYQVMLVEPQVVQEVHEGSAGGALGVVHQVPNNSIQVELQSNELNLATASVAGEINQVMELFQTTLNPTIKYGNKTQRKAIEELIGQFGLARVVKMVEYSGKISGEQFAPVITTPYQLQSKIGQLIAYHKKSFNKPQVVTSI